MAEDVNCEVSTLTGKMELISYASSSHTVMAVRKGKCTEVGQQRASQLAISTVDIGIGSGSRYTVYVPFPGLWLLTVGFKSHRSLDLISGLTTY